MKWLCIILLTCFIHYSSAQDMLSTAERAWLKGIVKPISSCDPLYGDSNFYVLHNLVKDATLVGLGEATHGTSEIFKMKASIIRYLIEHERFTCIAAEIGMANAEKLNDFILYGRGDIRTILKSNFGWYFATEETLTLLKWLYTYNSTHQKKVLFAGFDMQLYSGSFYLVDSIYKANGGQDTVLIRSLKRRLEKINEVKYPVVYGNTATTTGHRFKADRNNISGICDRLTAFAAKNIQDENDRAWFLQNLRLLLQYTDDMDGYDRDKYMAENALWLQKHHTDSKIVLWAHDGHLQKTKMQSGYKTMGCYLKRHLGDRYVSLAITTYKGNCNICAKKDIRTLASYDIETGFPGTYEYEFHQVGVPMFFLYLQDIDRNNDRSRWLAGRRFAFRELLVRGKLSRNLGHCRSPKPTTG